MLPQLMLGLGALLAVWLLLGWFSRANPAAARRFIKLAGFAALLVGGLWLVLTGKLAGLIAVVAGASPWIARGLRLHGLWRMFQSATRRRQGGQAQSGGRSRVETRFVRMELDHDSGHMDGEVLEGPLRGCRLSALRQDEALDLWRQAQVDGDSARVLAAWLDRVWPEWRKEEDASSPPPSAKAGMSDKEAREILGVGAAASAEEIRAAHRRLMLANHPDHGGSTWIAARINQARDLLLGG